MFFLTQHYKYYVEDWCLAKCYGKSEKNRPKNQIENF